MPILLGGGFKISNREPVDSRFTVGNDGQGGNRFTLDPSRVFDGLTMYTTNSNFGGDQLPYDPVDINKLFIVVSESLYDTADSASAFARIFLSDLGGQHLPIDGYVSSAGDFTSSFHNIQIDDWGNLSASLASIEENAGNQGFESVLSVNSDAGTTDIPSMSAGLTFNGEHIGVRFPSEKGSIKFGQLQSNAISGGALIVGPEDWSDNNTLTFEKIPGLNLLGGTAVSKSGAFGPATILVSSLYTGSGTEEVGSNYLSFQVRYKGEASVDTPATEVARILSSSTLGGRLDVTGSIEATYAMTSSAYRLGTTYSTRDPRITSSGDYVKVEGNGLVIESISGTTPTAQAGGFMVSNSIVYVAVEV